MATEKKKPIHWADFTAEKIIREKGDKEHYVCASGITPSGVVHFGSFREVITVDFVARALRDQGKKVRFIFSWDDYDTFRKIPKNMPKQEELEKLLYHPIVDVPDPYGEHESYAAHHEKKFEEQLKKVGIDVEPLYQAQKYRSSEYAQDIKKALDAREKIASILNEHRKEPLAKDWLPVLIYCESCNRDRVKPTSYDGEWTLEYSCELCGHQGNENIKESSRVKLPWRVDWPMRWAYEQVDFEPGGKDHSSQGGSFTTAKDIVGEVYGATAPTYLQYDFVSIKGAGGKMSSSSGNVITVNDVLKIYEPEMVRWIFASYKSNVDFSVSFDLDVIKTYEDFDRMERLVYGLEPGNEKKKAMAQRVYELSAIGEIPEKCPFQPSFRHLCNVLQIHGGDLSKAHEVYKDEIITERDRRRFEERSRCALYWLELYAPEDFKFSLNEKAPSLDLSEAQLQFLKKLHTTLEIDWHNLATEKDLHTRLYELIHEMELKPQDAFHVLYQILISREKGPKLAGFVKTIGKDRVVNLLSQVK